MKIRRRQRTHRRTERAGFLAHARSWMGWATSALLVVGLATFVGSSLQTQRLVGLRQQVADLEERLQEVRARHNDAQTRLLNARKYEVVGPRARMELGLVESDLSRRSFVALPAPAPAPETGFVASLAARLDRFAEVRTSLAAERER
mgnify:FL=1